MKEQICVNNLSIYLKKDMSPLIKNFSMTLKEYEKVAITGYEGAGKSTLLKSLYDANKIAEYAICEGDILKKGCSIGYVSQDMIPQHYDINVGQFLESIDTSNKLVISKTIKIAKELGMNVKYVNPFKLMKTFSGGEKVKIRLVLMVSMLNDIILIDEPGNDLDSNMLEWFKTFLIKCHFPVIYITGNIDLIKNIATKVVYFEKNKDNTEPKSKVSVLTCDEYEKVIFTEKANERNNCTSIDTERSEQGDTVVKIDIDRLELKSRLLSKELKLHVKKGKHVGIFGNNGLGKTVFLKTVYETVGGGYLSQDNIEFNSMDIACLSYLYNGTDESVKKEALSCLYNFGFDYKDAQLSIKHIPDGQKTLLKIAKLIFDEYEILFMDEPTRNLSFATRNKVKNLFRNYKATIVTVSNDKFFLDDVCDEIYEFTKEGLS